MVHAKYHHSVTTKVQHDGISLANSCNATDLFNHFKWNNCTA